MTEVERKESGTSFNPYVKELVIFSVTKRNKIQTAAGWCKLKARGMTATCSLKELACYTSFVKWKKNKKNKRQEGLAIALPE